MALIQHWKCQDNAASTVVVAAVGTNGTMLGGDNTSALSTVDGPGTAFPLSLTLDGTDDYFSISGVSFASGSAFSFAFWVKFSSLAANRSLMGSTASTAARVLVVNASNNLLVTGSSTTRTYVIPALSTGVWYHILVSRSAADSVRVFVNGTESSTGAQALAETVAPAVIGRSNAFRHAGPICDVRVYDSDESANVAAIMAEKNSGTIIPAAAYHLAQMGA